MTAPLAGAGSHSSTTTSPDRRIAVIVVILTVDEGQLKVLLIRRSADPFKDSWSLPGGLLTRDEALEQAAVRKLDDETGLSVADISNPPSDTVNGRCRRDQRVRWRRQHAVTHKQPHRERAGNTGCPRDCQTPAHTP